ncbi:hypothetical protein D3C86_1537410 [compost metagenome]
MRNPVFQKLRVIHNSWTQWQISHFGRDNRITAFTSCKFHEFPGCLLLRFIIRQDEQSATGIHWCRRFAAERWHRCVFQLPSSCFRRRNKTALQRTCCEQHTQLAFAERLRHIAIIQFVVRTTLNEILPHFNRTDSSRLTKLNRFAVIGEHFAAVAAN